MSTDNAQLFDKLGFLKHEHLSHVSVTKKSISAFDAAYSLGYKDSLKLGYARLNVEKRIFNCCGTSGLENLGFFLPEGEPGQEIVTILLQTMQYWEIKDYSFQQSPDLMFVVTDGQIKYNTPDTIYSWMLNHGAKKVDQFPNHVHGPYDLHLYRWNPHDCEQQLLDEKWIWFNTSMSFIPYYMKETWEKRYDKPAASAAVLEQAQEVVQQRLGGADQRVDVRPAFGAGIPQLDAVPNLPQQVNAANANPGPQWNPPKQGVQNLAAEGVGLNQPRYRQGQPKWPKGK